jgi:hypothetical protein
VCRSSPSLLSTDLLLFSRPPSLDADKLRLHPLLMPRAVGWLFQTQTVTRATGQTKKTREPHPFRLVGKAWFPPESQQDKNPCRPSHRGTPKIRISICPQLKQCPLAIHLKTNSEFPPHLSFIPLARRYDCKQTIPSLCTSADEPTR